MPVATEDPGRYHRLLGSHAPAVRRLAAGAALGLVVGFVAWRFVTWQLAVLIGWDVAAGSVLAVSWHVIGRCDGERTAYLSTIEDESRTSARLLVLHASLVSLLGVLFALHRASQEPDGWLRYVLIAAALVTVVTSWMLVNTIFTLRYAHLYYDGPDGGIDFGSDGPPDYKDFAYLAFTIGMTYQVSDTVLQTRRFRRTALQHALTSYVFGVVIVAMTLNVIAGFL